MSKKKKKQASSGMTYRQYLKTPAGKWDLIVTARDILANFTCFSMTALISRNHPATRIRKFIQFVNRTEREIKLGHCTIEAATAAFAAGEAFVQAELQGLAEKELQAQRYREAGGATQKRSKAEMAARLAEWDIAIRATGSSKKRQAMKRAGVPRATYYRYRKLLGQSAK